MRTDLNSDNVPYEDYKPYKDYKAQGKLQREKMDKFPKEVRQPEEALQRPSKNLRAARNDIPSEIQWPRTKKKQVFARDILDELEIQADVQKDLQQEREDEIPEFFNDEAKSAATLLTGAKYRLFGTSSADQAEGVVEEEDANCFALLEGL